MKKNFNKNNFDVCQLFTPSLKLIDVSVMRTCSKSLLDFTQTNSGKVCSETTERLDATC